MGLNVHCIFINVLLGNKRLCQMRKGNRTVRNSYISNMLHWRLSFFIFTGCWFNSLERLNRSYSLQMNMHRHQHALALTLRTFEERRLNFFSCMGSIGVCFIGAPRALHFSLYRCSDKRVSHSWWKKCRY